MKVKHKQHRVLAILLLLGLIAPVFAMDDNAMNDDDQIFSWEPNQAYQQELNAVAQEQQQSAQSLDSDDESADSKQEKEQKNKTAEQEAQEKKKKENTDALLRIENFTSRYDDNPTECVAAFVNIMYGRIKPGDRNMKRLNVLPGVLQKVICDYANAQYSPKITFSGHGYECCLNHTVIAALPDGNIAIGGTNIDIWDTTTRQYISTFEDHIYNDLGPRALTVWNGDIVSDSDDNQIKVWNRVTGQCTHTLTEHNDAVSALAVLPNGDLVSGSHDDTIKIWDGITKQCTHTLIHEGVNALAILPNGDIVSGSENGIIKVWDGTTKQCTHTLIGHNEPADGREVVAADPCLAISPNGDMISGSHGKTIKIWDAVTKECKHTITCDGPIKSLAISPNRNILAGIEPALTVHDSRISIYDSNTKKCIQIIRTGALRATEVSVLPNEDIVFYKSDEAPELEHFTGAIQIWGYDQNFADELAKTMKELSISYDENEQILHAQETGTPMHTTTDAAPAVATTMPSTKRTLPDADDVERNNSKKQKKE